MSSTPIYLGKNGKISGPFTSGQIEELRQNGQLYNYSWIWDVKIKGWKAIEEEVEEVELSVPTMPPPGAGEIIPVATAEPSLAIPSRPGVKPMVISTQNISQASRNLTPEVSESADLLRRPVDNLEISIDEGSQNTPSAARAKSAQSRTAGGLVETVDVICYNHQMMMSGKLGAVSQKGCLFQSILPIYNMAPFKAGMKISMNLLNNPDGQSENIRASVRVVKRGEEYWEYELSWDRFPQILSQK